MNHPFELDAAELEAMDLDFGEPLTDEEAAHIRGGIGYTTQAVGEEGGGSQGGGGFAHQPIFDPPMTTQAMGEEGGDPLHW
jgi:hypothetical protein